MRFKVSFFLFLVCSLVMVIVSSVVAAIDTTSIHTAQGIADAIVPKYKPIIDAVSALIITVWTAVVAVVAFIRGHFHGKASVLLNPPPKQ